jgi:hypothetical protein
LLGVEASFLRVREGPVQAVDALYARSELGPRHVLRTRRIRESIDERSLEDGTMGLCQATRPDVARIVGLKDFLCLSHFGPDEHAGRASKLLAAFREGRWRERISA